MTGPEHYREAERLIAPGEYDEAEPDLLARDIALAQVHATLALAAATALSPIGEGWDRAIFTQWGLATGWTPAELDLEDDEATEGGDQ